MDYSKKELRAEAIKAAGDSSKKAKRAIIDLVKAGYGVHAVYENLVKKGLIHE